MSTAAVPRTEGQYPSRRAIMRCAGRVRRPASGQRVVWRVGGAALGRALRGRRSAWRRPPGPGRAVARSSAVVVDTRGTRVAPTLSCHTLPHTNAPITGVTRGSVTASVFADGVGTARLSHHLLAQMQGRHVLHACTFWGARGEEGDTRLSHRSISCLALIFNLSNPRTTILHAKKAVPGCNMQRSMYSFFHQIDMNLWPSG